MVMQAAVFHGHEDVRITERPIPTPGPGELLIKVAAVGVCGTDVGEWDHGPIQVPLHAAHPVTGHVGPMILGHEFSGTVIARGPQVGEEWQGARVASCGSIACGTCASCRNGASNRCPQYAGVGLHRDGALAQYVTAPTESCIAIDGTGMSLDEAALCQPMAVAMHCVSRAGHVAGESVLMLGAGGIGIFLVAALQAAGARVVATDLQEDRLELARELGADETVLGVGDESDIERIKSALSELTPSVIFEVSGTAAGMSTALALADRGTRIVAVGIQKEPLKIDLAQLTLQEISLIGTNALVREVDFPRAVELVAARSGIWHRIAPKLLPLGHIEEGALRLLRAGGAPALKMLIDPWAENARDLTEGDSTR